jgi:hypothetical protein
VLVQSSVPFPAPETWRAVPGYEGQYEVSDQGRVRSWRNFGAASDRPRVVPLMLRPTTTRDGYRVTRVGEQQ